MPREIKPSRPAGKPTTPRRHATPRARKQAGDRADGGDARGAARHTGVEVLRWAHGGDGVASIDGRVVFLPGAVPGDVVDVAIVEDRGRWARARVLRVATPSPERREPPCAVQARCGGCPWMIGSAAAQARSRELILRGEVRKRLGEGVAVAMAEGGGPELGYRQRARLTYRDGALGYLARASHELVAIERCPVLDPRIDDALASVRAHVTALGGHGRVSLLAGEEGVAGWVEPADGTAHALGMEAVTLALGPFRQRLQARAFAQANASVTAAMLHMIGEVAGPAEGRRAVELFAGSGTLTQALWAQGWTVHAYELDPAARAAFEATRDAQRGYGAWHACDLASGLVRPAPPAGDEARGARGFDLVLLDPPRTGAADVMPWVRACPARTVIYVSCDLATGLRDLKTLCADGRWQVERVVGFDMFPHSGHQEVVAVARRVGG